MERGLKDSKGYDRYLEKVPVIPRSSKSCFHSLDKLDR